MDRLLLQPISRGLRVTGQWGPQAVTKRFGRRPPVLREVTLALVAGEAVHVVGRNGCGKSTLLRVAAGLTAPTSGRVRVPPRVGYVPDRGDLGANLPVTEYLQRMAALRPGPRAVDELVDRYGLASHRSSRMCDLSKGTVKKVAVVQALLDHNDLLVLDEPTDGLDQQAITALRDDLSSAARAGTAVLFACHTRDLDDLPVPTRTVTLDAGTLHAVEPARAGDRVVRVEVLPAGASTPGIHVVPDSVVDALLADLLRDGAHVVRVEPLAGQTP